MKKAELNKMAIDVNTKAHNISYDELLNSDMLEHLHLLKKVWNTDNGIRMVDDLIENCKVFNDQLAAINSDLKQLKGLNVTVSYYKGAVKAGKVN